MDSSIRILGIKSVMIRIWASMEVGFRTRESSSSYP